MILVNKMSLKNARSSIKCTKLATVPLSNNLDSYVLFIIFNMNIHIFYSIGNFNTPRIMLKNISPITCI